MTAIPQGRTRRAALVTSICVCALTGTAVLSGCGSEEGVIASLTMMIAGVVMVLIAPVIGSLLGSAFG